MSAAAARTYIVCTRYGAAPTVGTKPTAVGGDMSKWAKPITYVPFVLLLCLYPLGMMVFDFAVGGNPLDSATYLFVLFFVEACLITSQLVIDVLRGDL